MAYIKEGWGFNVGQDFARAVIDTPLDITHTRGQYVYGTIAGNPDSKLGFLRPDRVYVTVQARAVQS